MIWNAAVQKWVNSAELYSLQQTTVGTGSACHRTKAVLSLTQWYASCRFSFGSTSREMWLWFPSLLHHSALWRTSRWVITSDRGAWHVQGWHGSPCRASPENWAFSLCMFTFGQLRAKRKVTVGEQSFWKQYADNLSSHVMRCLLFYVMWMNRLTELAWGLSAVAHHKRLM